MLEPWQNWGIICTLGIGAYLYYSRSGKSKRGRGRLPFARDHSSKQDSKAQAGSKGLDQIIGDVAGVSSSSISNNGKSRVKKRKGTKKQDSKSAQSSAVETGPSVEPDVDSGDGEDDAIDNQEFARQLSGLKTGTSLNKPSSASDKPRTGQQGKHNEAKGSEAALKPANGAQDKKQASATSSTTGADGDDDLSPAMSPELRASQSMKASGDVSDMLEVPGKGPSILRLTEPLHQHVARQPSPKKAAQEPETKKQRQNRRKNEERKQAKEEVEQERRVALEKQLRTAREAEGRPAKNGASQAKQATASTAGANAWSLQEGEAASSSKVSSNVLLDTFDKKPSTKASAHSEGGNDDRTAQDKRWEHDLPSEEEQMRMLSEMEGNDGWNTVEKGGKSKRKQTTTMGEHEASEAEKKSSVARGKTGELTADSANGTNPNEKYDTSTNSTTSNSGADAGRAGFDVRTNQPVIIPSNRKTVERADPTIWNRENIHNHPDYDPNFPWALIGHPDDSDWAVI